MPPLCGGTLGWQSCCFSWAVKLLEAGATAVVYGLFSLPAPTFRQECLDLSEETEKNAEMSKKF